MGGMGVLVGEGIGVLLGTVGVREGVIVGGCVALGTGVLVRVGGAGVAVGLGRLVRVGGARVNVGRTVAVSEGVAVGGASVAVRVGIAVGVGTNSVTARSVSAAAVLQLEIATSMRSSGTRVTGE